MWFPSIVNLTLDRLLLAMSTYWDAYPNFVHNPTAPLRQEFKLLAAQCGWQVDGERYKREWGHCGQAEFSHHFGRDDNRLAGWQAMCATARVEAPDSIKQCKQVSPAPYRFEAAMIRLTSRCYAPRSGSTSST